MIMNKENFVSLERIREEIRSQSSVFREHDVLAIVIKHLKENGWQVKEQVKINGGSIDIGADKGPEIFLIEAKGEDKGGYTSAEMNFQMGLGQLMSRMKYQNAKYGLAIPLTRDFIKVLQKYQGSFAFEKLNIYLFLTGKDGICRIIHPHNIEKFLEEIVS